MKLTFDTRPRYGHNHATSMSTPIWSKVTYMAHAKGYVMARRPGCMPFVITEKQWRDFPPYDGRPYRRAAIQQQEGRDAKI